MIELTQYKFAVYVDGVADHSELNGLIGLREPVPRLRVLNGVHSGKQILLTKTLTTIGKLGEQVAVITCQAEGYFITHIEGDACTAANGKSIGIEIHKLDMRYCYVQNAVHVLKGLMYNRPVGDPLLLH